MIDTSTADRLTAVEERVAHQETVIEDLNAAVTAQWAVIDALRRQLTAMADRVADAEARAETAAPNQPPPHY